MGRRGSRRAACGGSSGSLPAGSLWKRRNTASEGSNVLRARRKLGSARSSWRQVRRLLLRDQSWEVGRLLTVGSRENMSGLWTFTTRPDAFESPRSGPVFSFAPIRRAPNAGDLGGSDSGPHGASACVAVSVSSALTRHTVYKQKTGVRPSEPCHKSRGRNRQGQLDPQKPHAGHPAQSPRMPHALCWGPSPRDLGDSGAQPSPPARPGSSATWAGRPPWPPCASRPSPRPPCTSAPPPRRVLCHSSSYHRTRVSAAWVQAPVCSPDGSPPLGRERGWTRSPAQS